ncbi:MAG: hypothetical protein M0R06_01335 [Sphaerochaeta sp.]|jgi:hypothetical protein|nr:hypothetical protein [Sphaerochaeta sp.]
MDKQRKVLFPQFWIDPGMYIAFRAKARREGIAMARILRAAIAKYLE